MTRTFTPTPEAIDEHEWLLANGLGGYAMGTVSGIATRRYHGLLIAATPTGRVLTLAAIDGSAAGGREEIALSANQYPGAIFPDGLASLRRVEVGSDHVTWHHGLGDLAVARTLRVEAGKNGARVEYRNEGTLEVALTLRPLLAMRDHHAETHADPSFPASLVGEADALVVTQGVTLRLEHVGAVRTPVQGWYYRFEHLREQARGLPELDDLYCPCELAVTLLPGATFTLAASVEPTVKVGKAKARATKPAEAAVPEGSPRGDSLRERLTVAAERHLAEFDGRPGIIAGYPWFSDWGRDTMVSLPGLCLATGKSALARRILEAYGAQMRHGLIPNRFTEAGGTDLNTVDATLWFANAIYRTLEAEWDAEFAARMLVLLEASIDWHVRGTEFGIRMDPEDGLLRQGEPGLQLTWMDAKIDDWVVTPRHGKPVEIAALWINMLRIVLHLRERLGTTLAPADDPYLEIAELATTSFERCYWHEGRGHYLDTVDPDDASLRPNQVIAMAVPFSPCDPEHSRRALAVVKERLATPFGLRTLAPEEAGYRGQFQGAIRELDAAYHQGTVWPWLTGPYVAATARFGDAADGQALLANVEGMLDDLGVEGIAECYDGDAPHRPNGCPFQAWSVAAYLEHLA